MKTSRIPGFYKLGIEERLQMVKEFSSLSDSEVLILKNGITLEQADRLIENVIGTVRIPLGVAVNFLINGKEYLIPMATEESSVVAAASNAARMAREGDGFKAWSTESIMIGQIQLISENPENAKSMILKNKEKILKIANKKGSVLIKLGGGAKDIEVRILDTKKERMVITHLIVDVRDAMGANIVNTMVERVAPFIEEITNGKVYLKIVSNFAVKRLACASVIIPSEAVGGSDVVDAVILAYEFANSDPYRAVTHNKGIMNGISAVALATGNDTRAVEAGAHAYAAKNGGYKPLSTWEKDEEGDLIGKIEIPMAVGTVGGATSTPSAKAALKILGVNSSRELAEVIASVGLAQNLAALRALATEGIQKGHMRLHARKLKSAN